MRRRRRLGWGPECAFRDSLNKDTHKNPSKVETGRQAPRSVPSGKGADLQVAQESGRA